MKFDIEGLSQKELNDAELDAVYGGWGGSGLGVGASGSLASSTNIHSFSGFCDMNIFSVNVISGWVKGILSIANCNTQVCASHD